MSSIISDESFQLVRATAPVVAEHIEEITGTFYPKMLGRHPELYQFFNESNQRAVPGLCPAASGVVTTRQSKTLGDAVVQYALNIDKLENLNEAVLRIAHKHCALGVKAEHYQIVHDNLMEAIGEVLGSAVTPEVAAAWSEAVMALGKIFIEEEQKLYNEAEKLQWSGPKEFIITEIIDETPVVKSFRMKSKDGQKVCPFKPGQYLSIYEQPNNKKYFAPRHYTITSQPEDDFYQITIKKLIDPAVPDDRTHDGILSHYLHSKNVNDVIKLGPIFGPEVLLQGEKSRVAAFISVGIGITPTMGILPTAVKERPRIAVFHGDVNGSNHVSREALEEFGNEQSLFSYSYFSPNEADTKSKHYSEGLLTGSKIVDKLKDAGVNFATGTDYFICAGPTVAPILVNELRELGVDKKFLHLEFFGPFVSLIEE